MAEVVIYRVVELTDGGGADVVPLGYAIRAENVFRAVRAAMEFVREAFPGVLVALQPDPGVGYITFQGGSYDRVCLN